MPDYTPLGYPYPEDLDKVDVAGDVKDLAEAVDASPGISSLTEQDIEALLPGEARLGRQIHNITSARQEFFDGSNWVPLETQAGAQARANAAQAAAQDHSDQAVAVVAGQVADLGADLAAHESLTAGVHGIPDTSALATVQDVSDAEAATAQVAADLAAHSESTTSVHGITDVAELATKAYADQVAAAAAASVVDSVPATLDTLNELAAALGDDANFASTVTVALGEKADSSTVSAHTSATTAVHGIADTSVLETQSGAQAKADAAQAAAIGHADQALAAHDLTTLNVHGIANTSELETQTGAQAKADNAQIAAELTASTALNAHVTGTTGVHGIPDTSTLVVTSDPRLSDVRAPALHAASHAMLGSDPITPGSIGAALAAHSHVGFTAASEATGSGDLIVGAEEGVWGTLPAGSGRQLLSVNASGTGVNRLAWVDPAITVQVSGSEPTDPGGYLWVDTTEEV